MNDELDELTLSDDGGIDVDPSSLVAPDLDEVGLDGLELSEDDGLGFDSNFDFSVEDELENLSVTGLFQATPDIVSEFSSYANYTSKALEILNTKKLDTVQEAIKYSVSRSDFSYMPNAVFGTFHKLLVDMVIDKYNEYGDKSVDDCLNITLNILLRDAHWTPKLNSKEFVDSFKRWFSKLRKLPKEELTESEKDLRNTMDIENLALANCVFTINSEVFREFNVYLTDPVIIQKFSGFAMEYSHCGEYLQAFMQNANRKSLTIPEVYDVLLDLLAGQDVARILKLPSESYLDLSRGEVLRRLIQFELGSQLIDLKFLVLAVDVSSMDVRTEFNTYVTIIRAGRDAGSLGFEIAWVLLQVMILNTNPNFDSIKGNYPLKVTRMLFAYIKMFYTPDSAFVNPVIYESVSLEEDGTYSLDYLMNDTACSVRSTSILCDIVGTHLESYCVPRVLVDVVNGCAVCPPSSVIVQTNKMSISTKSRLNAPLVYKFEAVINCLIEIGMLAQDFMPEKSASNKLSNVDDSLLQTLIKYHNDFDNSIPLQQACVLDVPSKSITLYAFRFGPQEGYYRLCSVTERNSDGTSGNRLNKSVGVMIHSEDSLLVQYIDRGGENVTFSIPLSDCSEVNTGSPDGAEALNLTVRGMVKYKGIESEANDSLHHTAVLKLCDLTAFDYNEELLRVQSIISRDLMYVLHITSIDELLASYLIDEYVRFIDDSPEGLDTYNLSSLQELTNILLGVPNELSGYAKWSFDCKESLDKIRDTLIFTVNDVCRYLDSMDFDIYALQSLSDSQISRVTNSDMYYALHGIPEIGSRLSVLEDKMITMRALHTMGVAQVRLLFGKKKYLTDIYDLEITQESIDEVNDILVRKSKRKGPEKDVFTLPLTKSVLNAEGHHDSVILKYFTLERNLLGMFTICATHCDNSLHSDFCSKIVEFIGASNFEEVTEERFKANTTKDSIVKFCLDNERILQSFVIEGLLVESMNPEIFATVKAFDLFNSSFSKIIGEGYIQTVESGVDYNRKFMDYAGSFILSYCPLNTPAVDQVIGGVDRISAFLKMPSEFYSVLPLDGFREYDVTDIRLLSGE